MIPEFDESGLLPEGVHMAVLSEIRKRYAVNAHRVRLLGGLERALQDLHAAGCGLLYLDGSFVTAKEFPGDYDACWDPIGVNLGALDPVLRDFSNLRAAQKAKYFGEFFPSTARADAKSPYRTFLNFFQVDKNSGARKGIIGITIAKIV